MNLRQMRYLAEVVSHGFNITAAAAALHTSQPGVSKQLLLLERELGVDLLLRRGNRIVGLTEPGSKVWEVARRMLLDAESLRAMGQEFGTRDEGRLAIGTTHTQARYVLPSVIQRFKSHYPRVQLAIRLENEGRVAELVSAGEVDIGVSAEPRERHEELLLLPCYELPRSLLMRPGHPLLAEKRLTLERIARHPVITLDASFAGGRKVLQAFAAKGIPVTVAMTATDADIIKFYAELGLGVAILPTVAFEPERDRLLRAVDASRIFEPTVVGIQVRRNHYLRRYTFDFIQMLAPQWSHAAIERAIRSGEVPPRRIVTYPPGGRVAAG